MADTNNEATSPAPAALIVKGIPVGVPVPVDAELDPDSDNPVSNKAVCDKFDDLTTKLNDGTSKGEWIGTFSGQCLQNAKAYRKGNTVFVQGCLQFSGLTVNQYYQFGSGLPKPACGAMVTLAPNEYAQAGTAVISMNANGTISAKCSHANAYYYFTMAYPTHDGW